MPIVSEDDLGGLGDANLAGAPAAFADDELKNFASVNIDNTDAPRGFWERRFSDVLISVDRAARPIGSALVFMGDSLRQPSVPDEIEKIASALNPEDATRLRTSMQDTHVPMVADTIGKSFIRLGTSWQDHLDKLIEFESRGRQDEGQYDLPRDLTQGGLSILGSVGGAMMFGALTPSLAITGGSAVETYDAARRKGKDYDEAVKIGTIMGISQGVPEFWGLHTMITVAGGAIKRVIKSALAEGIQETTQQAGQETVERVSGISESTKGGWAAVEEATVNSLYAGALGMALGGFASSGPALMARNKAKTTFRELGYSESEANALADKAIRVGMDKALGAAEFERALTESGVYRDVDGSPIEVSPEGVRVLSSEEVVAKFQTTQPIAIKMVEEAKAAIAQVLPQQETVGVTEGEKILVEPSTVEEALKYDTAEEYVASKASSSHYSDKEINTFDNKPTWFTTSPSGYNRRVNATVKNEVGIKEGLNLANKKQATELGMYRGDINQFANNLKDAGFDGAKFTQDGDTHHFILDTKNIKTKSQLRSEWQAAQDQRTVSPVLLKTLEDTFSKIERQVKDPRAVTKQRVKAVQKALANFIKSKDLGAIDREKFTARILNTQTIQQLERILPEIKERINKLREAQDQRTEVARFKGLTKRSRLARTRPEYRKTIEGIVSNLSANKLTTRKLMELEKLADFIVENPENMIPQYRIDELRRLEMRSIRDFAAKDLRLVNDALAHLYKLNENKATIIFKRRLTETQEVVARILKAVSSAPGKFDEVSGVLTPSATKHGGSWMEVVKKFLTLDQENAELIAQRLEGKDAGDLQYAVHGGFDEAQTNFLRIKQTAEKLLKAGFGKIKIDSWSEYLADKPSQVKTDEFTFIGRKGSETIALSKAEQISLFLLMQNENSARHITGGGVSFDKEALRGYAYQIQPAELARLMERVANDPEMLQVADTVSAYLNGFQKELLNKTSLALNGYELATEDNYIRIRVNPNMRNRMAEIKNNVSFSHFLLESLGFTKERTVSEAPIYLEDVFASTYESMIQASTYASFAEPLRVAKRILNDQEIRTALIRQGREAELKALEEHVMRVEGDRTNMQGFERVAADLQGQIQASILRLNPWIVLKQPASYFSAGTEIDMKYLARNYKPVVAKQELDEIEKWSPQIFDRFQGHINRELGELANVGVIKQFYTGKAPYGDWMMVGIRKTDGASITSIWRAVKDEIRTEKPELKGDEFFKAVATRAEFLVRRTQATYNMNDRSALQANPGFLARTLTLFGSETNKQFIMIRRAAAEWQTSNKTWADRGKFTKRLVLVYAVNSFLMASVNALRNSFKAPPEKEDEDEAAQEKIDAIAKQFFYDLLTGPLGRIYGVREAAAMIGATIVKGAPSWEINNPVFATATDFVVALGKLAAAAEQFVTDERYAEGTEKEDEKKWTKNAADGIKELVISGAAMKGFPAANIERLIKPLFTENEGEE